MDFDGYTSLTPRTPCNTPQYEVPYPIAYPFYYIFSETPHWKESHGSFKEESDDNEGVEKIVRDISKLYLKLPLKLRKQVTLDIMKRGNVGGDHEPGSGLDVARPMTQSRGLGEPIEEFDKLERFKMKTINAGVIKDDDAVK